MALEIYTLEASDTPTADFLNTQEQDRFGKIADPDQRKFFLRTRVFVRQSLSAFSGIPFTDIRLLTTEVGKPYFENNLSIHFSLTHSGENAWLAVSNKQVGLDSEKISVRSSFLKIAERFFLPSEIKLVRDSNEQFEVFLKIWTIKEALVKAAGTGMFANMNDIEIGLDEKGFQKILKLPSDWTTLERWEVRSWKTDLHLMSLALLN